tara:strand:- start:488 stop:739 length:252 start_codon:yes stop_codon:yes gene_type:complete
MVKEVVCAKCGHKWETKSELVLVACASCFFRNKNPNTMEIKNKKIKLFLTEKQINVERLKKLKKARTLKGSYLMKKRAERNDV